MAALAAPLAVLLGTLVPTGMGAGPAAAADTASAPAAGARSGCATPITAHRGVHDTTHTENTRRSAIQAALRGADTVEGDLQLTRDGVWVLMHDPTVNRTTRGTGTVAKMSYAQVHALTTDDGVRGGVPSLATLLDTMQHYPEVDLQLEIKPSTVSTTALKTLRATFAKYLVAPRLLITSYHTAPLAKIRSYSTNWKVAPIGDTQITAAATRQLGTVAIIKETAVTASYVRQMHGQGLEVYGWVADTQAVWDRLVGYDVDSITTNDVVGAAGWCAA